MEIQWCLEDQGSGFTQGIILVNFPVDVFGQLSATAEGSKQFQLEGRGDAIVVKLPDLATGRVLARQTSGRARRLSAIRKLHASLQLTDLRLQILVADTLVAHLGPDSGTTLLSTLLGLGPLKLKPWSLLVAMFHRTN